MSACRIYLRTGEGIPSGSGAEWLQRIGTAVEDPSSRLLKDYGPQSATLTYRVDLPGVGTSWLKKYRITMETKLLSPFRKSRGRRVWHLSESLLREGAHIPKPYLVVEEYRWGFLRRSYVATEWLEGRIPLTDWFRQERKAGRDADDVVRSTIFRCVGTAAAFHRLAVIHGDLKWSNFLLPQDLQGAVFLVDLDAARFTKSPRQRGKDLARFTITALTEGMPVEIMDGIFEEYCEALQPPEAGHIQRAYEDYVRKRLPELFL